METYNGYTYKTGVCTQGSLVNLDNPVQMENRVPQMVAVLHTPLEKNSFMLRLQQV